MKTIVIPALLALFALPQVSHAQSNNKNSQQETIIIKKKESGNPQTVVEIKNGDIIVNGEKVATTDGAANRKIIIDSDDDMRNMDFDKPIARKAMLGIYTAASKDEAGVVVQSVTPNSGAEKAGLKKGDILTKVDNKAVSTPKELVEMLSSYNVGDDVALTYKRDGKTHEAKAVLSKAPAAFSFEMPDLDNIPNPFDKPFFENLKKDIFNQTPKLGISAEDRADGSGVRVADILSASPAADAHLQKDDIITKLDNKKVSSIDELQNALRDAEMDKKIPLHYMRNGKAYTTEVFFKKPVRKKDL